MKSLLVVSAPSAPHHGFSTHTFIGSADTGGGGGGGGPIAYVCYGSNAHGSAFELLNLNRKAATMARVPLSRSRKENRSPQRACRQRYRRRFFAEFADVKALSDHLPKMLELHNRAIVYPSMDERQIPLILWCEHSPLPLHSR